MSVSWAMIRISPRPASLTNRSAAASSVTLETRTFNAGPEAVEALFSEALDLKSLLNRPLGELSAGQRTRAGLAKAFINRPRVILLDEPTASLDPDTADWVRTYLARYARDENATFLIASHNMPEVERLCDQVLMMRAGRIVDVGSPAGLLAKYSRTTLEEVFLDVARERTKI